jgi:hypothetical protein
MEIGGWYYWIIVLFVTTLLWLLCRAINRILIKWWGYRAWYNAIYLHMPNWWLTKKVVYAIHGGRCQKHGPHHGPLTVHHKSYRYKWLEWATPWNMELLCWEHHKQEQAKIK